MFFVRTEFKSSVKRSFLNFVKLVELFAELDVYCKFLGMEAMTKMLKYRV